MLVHYHCTGRRGVCKSASLCWCQAAWCMAKVSPTGEGRWAVVEWCRCA